MHPDLVDRVENPVGSLRLLRRAPVQGLMFGTGGPGERSCQLEPNFLFFGGIDWGTEQHRICIMDRDGKVVGERWTPHSSAGLTELITWLREILGTPPASVAVAIEVPRGAIVEALTEHGFAVFSINPKQLDRFRDRYSPAGAKDDRRDAFVLADSLRTDRHCFHAVRLAEPALIRLRELSRLEDNICDQQHRLINQLRAQWHRFFPQLLVLCHAADEAWVWDLFEAAPLPALAARLPEKKIAKILDHYRIRRLRAPEIRTVLATAPLLLAPGSAEAASEHALLLLPGLRLLRQQRAEVARRLNKLLSELASPDNTEGEAAEHRDAEVLLSLPGVGRFVAATMLSEASQAIADRDYHALRSYAGAAPVTRQSGKKTVVLMRHGCNERLRNALYHWARVSTICDPGSRSHYAQLRARGHSHGRSLRGVADRWLRVLISMLRHGTLYDPVLQKA
jgi:transposase